jgi:hypothetical protein
MTVISLHVLGLRAAALSLGSEELVGVLAQVYRHVVEAAANRGATLSPADGQQLHLVWRGEIGVPAQQASWTGWELMRHVASLQESVAREHGIQLTPRMGIATGLKPVAAGGENPAIAPVTEEQLLHRADLLQRANLFYGTAILLDEETVVAGDHNLELLEIDRITADGEGFLRSREAEQMMGAPPGTLAAFDGVDMGIFQMLGPKGEVAPARLGAAAAFRGAVELFRQREWPKAYAVLQLLARIPNPEPLVQIYLSACRKQIMEERVSEADPPAKARPA